VQKAGENIQGIEKLVPRSRLFYYIDKVLYFGKKKPKPVSPENHFGRQTKNVKNITDKKGHFH
jgi:hypothetical protein